MANQIATITIPALVIAMNNTEFYDSDGYGYVGKVIDVPCRNIYYDNVDAWAVPQKDYGIFTGFTFLIKAGENIDQPTDDSFTVFRIKDKMSNNWWWIYGSKEDLKASCNTCCGEEAVPMPGVDGVNINIAPCYRLCDLLTNDGTRVLSMALPTLDGGEAYFPKGYFNNVELAAADAGGYSTIEDLITFLNNNWGSIGSPAVSVGYVNNDGVITATFTDGDDEDMYCFSINAISP